MAKRLLFTPAVRTQIGPWVRDGVSPAEVAQRIGCTVGTLRVRCSELGISLKHSGARSQKHNRSFVRTHPHTPMEQPPVQNAWLKITLNERTMERFERTATSTGRSSAALATALLEKIVHDGLYEAVLDEESQIAAKLIA